MKFNLVNFLWVTYQMRKEYVVNKIFHICITITLCTKKTNEQKLIYRIFLKLHFFFLQICGHTLKKKVLLITKNQI